MWEKHAGAIITGLAAILAAGLTAYLGGVATVNGIEEQGERAAQQRSAQIVLEARGAARLLIGEFLISANEMTDLAMDGTMERFGTDYPVDIPPADLQLVAARLSPSDYRKVNAALSDVTELNRYITQRSHPRHPLARRPLSRHSVNLLALDVASVGKATVALQELAELDHVAIRTLNPDAAFARIRRYARRAGAVIPE